MKAILILLIFIWANGLAQPAIDSGNRISAFSFINESITTYKVVVKCVDSHLYNSVYSDNSLCQTYQYLPALVDPVDIAGVSFATLFLMVDSQKRIQNISWQKQYIGQEKEFKNDKQLLADYFTQYFRMPGRSKKNSIEPVYDGKSRIWELPSMNLTLHQSTQRQEFNNKKVSSIQIWIEPKK